jgi:hypothetical protein
MHDSGAAVAEPDDAPLLWIEGRSSSHACDPQPLPGLLDPRTVRAELMRLRTPRRGSAAVGLGRARLARWQGTSDDGPAV